MNITIHITTTTQTDSMMILMQGFSSVALPNLGSGIFGYEPRSSSKILAVRDLKDAVYSSSQIPCSSNVFLGCC